ncbi:hypothetical protein Micbo1qcDRAFT_173727 [Microdochium bolleyi]|uniref:Uncharacterized protein n=1 Tax=Microdochium bolleyi TaxID=196109 RepID=A0A136J5X2_9PEZI|nr:hypothetical protein Micbo1qcDRAFT_173727 [Microdochium bolleyi]
MWSLTAIALTTALAGSALATKPGGHHDDHGCSPGGGHHKWRRGGYGGDCWDDDSGHGPEITKYCQGYNPGPPVTETKYETKHQGTTTVTSYTTTTSCVGGAGVGYPVAPGYGDHKKRTFGRRLATTLRTIIFLGPKPHGPKPPGGHPPGPQPPADHPPDNHGDYPTEPSLEPEYPTQPPEPEHTTPEPEHPTSEPEYPTQEPEHPTPEPELSYPTQQPEPQPSYPAQEPDRDDYPTQQPEPEYPTQPPQPSHTTQEPAPEYPTQPPPEPEHPTQPPAPEYTTQEPEPSYPTYEPEPEPEHPTQPPQPEYPTNNNDNDSHYPKDKHHWTSWLPWNWFSHKLDKDHHKRDSAARLQISRRTYECLHADAWSPEQIAKACKCKGVSGARPAKTVYKTEYKTEYAATATETKTQTVRDEHCTDNAGAYPTHY